MKYLDTNILVYSIEAHPVYGKACSKIIGDIKSGKLRVICSMLILVEFLNALQKMNAQFKRENKPLIDIPLSLDAVLLLPIEWIDINFFLIKQAGNYDVELGGNDSIHLATMEWQNAHEIISADKGFDKINFVKRIDPLHY